MTVAGLGRIQRQRQSWALFGLALALLVCLPALAVQSQASNSRQVTVFGIIASPHHAKVDPKLKPIEAQLKKLLPNHGFTLLAVENKRLSVGQSMSCTLGQTGFTTSTEMTEYFDLEGKVALRFSLQYNGTTELATIVRTPPNQLSFCDKTLPQQERLLIGLGAR